MPESRSVAQDPFPQALGDRALQAVPAGAVTLNRVRWLPFRRRQRNALPAAPTSLIDQVPCSGIDDSYGAALVRSFFVQDSGDVRRLSVHAGRIGKQIAEDSPI